MRVVLHYGRGVIMVVGLLYVAMVLAFVAFILTVAREWWPYRWAWRRHVQRQARLDYEAIRRADRLRESTGP